jgi:hypothetical protein
MASHEADVASWNYVQVVELANPLNVVLDVDLI